MPVCPPPLVFLRVGNSPVSFPSFFICLSYPYFLRVGVIPASFASAARRFCSPMFAGFLLVVEAAETKRCAVHVLFIPLFIVFSYKWIVLYIMNLQRYFEVTLHPNTGCLWLQWCANDMADLPQQHFARFHDTSVLFRDFPLRWWKICFPFHHTSRLVRCIPLKSVGRWGSFSCCVDSNYSLHSMFNNTAFQWKSSAAASVFL